MSVDTSANEELFHQEPGNCYVGYLIMIQIEQGQCNLGITKFWQQALQLTIFDSFFLDEFLGSLIWAPKVSVFLTN